MILDLEDAVAPEAKAQALALMPRITDSYNGFLSRIDSSAFSRRGILEIIRAELATRTRFVLGDDAVHAPRRWATSPPQSRGR